MKKTLERLKKGSAVIRRLKNVKIHIEKPYPFLIVAINQNMHIQKLLWGFPSYMIFERFEDREKKLLEEILRELINRFKSALILNVEERERQKAVFGIKTHRYGELTDVVESLKNSLEEISIHREHPSVKIYKSPIKKLIALDKTFQINLSIKPIYKDEESLYPYEFRKIHHGFTVSAKKAFYTFSMRYSSYRPSHYFEIGKRIFNRVVWNIDKKLTEIGDAFDFLMLLTPVNIESCWREFEKSKFTKKPEFHYRPVDFEVSNLKKKLFSVPVEHVEDPVLYEIFKRKRDELDIQLSMIENRGSEKCLWGSVQLYGRVDEKTLKNAEMILKADYREREEEKNITAKELARMAEEEIDYYRQFYPDIKSKVKVREDIVSKAIVSDGNLYIYKYAVFSKREAISLLNHEVGTHILTYVNGLNQKFRLLHVGLDGYDEMQEGLAVLSELLTDSLSFNRLRVLSARVVASDMITNGADFIEVFHRLQEYGFSERDAFMITSRVFRGGGLIKDSIYLRGFIRILDFIKENEEIELLYCGKFAFSHYPMIRELVYRGLVKRPVLIPKYLKSAVEKLKKIKTKTNLFDLIKEISI